MTKQILGIHHITAVASDAQRNVDFYAGALGLRLVKQTVNYDDPATYHLYYGDETGLPGTILSFFPWMGARRGQRGTGQVTVTSLCVPEGSINYWITRLKSHEVYAEHTERFEEDVLIFSDPDGLELELVATRGVERRPCWAGGPVPGEYTIRGFHGVTIFEEGYERTAALLTQVLGFRAGRKSGNRFRFETGPGGPGTFLDLRCLPGAPQGTVGPGTVHHIAWRTPNPDEQLRWHKQLILQGYNVTPVMNRDYFNAIYFREPGGVLFEIATDGPGFIVNEKPDELGSQLTLPGSLEAARDQIEHILPRLHAPEAAATFAD